jgi:thioesterase domain-containing protein
MRRAGLGADIRTLFASPTIAALAGAVTQLSSEKPETDHAGLLPVRSTGTQRPLFLIHEHYGLDLYFPVLGAQIDADIPVYGLPGVSPGEPLLHTMEGLATRIVGIIRTIQPSGPYRLAGWSFGGVLAYEIAAQLIGHDEAVEFLGLLDTYPLPRRQQLDERPSYTPSRMLLELCKERPENAGEDISVLEEVAENVTFEELLHECRGSEFASFLDDYSNDAVKHIIHRAIAHGHALEHYTLHDLPLVPHLFVSEAEQQQDLTSNLLDIWKSALPAQQFKRIAVPGNHLTMMDDPNVAVLGKAISDTITNIADRPIVGSETRFDPFVTIQQGTSAKGSLLCIPGAGDNVTGFIELGLALGEDWALHGMQPRGLDGQSIPHTSVDAAAACYLQAMAAAKIRGPLHLIGHSFGGWVAFEMACRLHESGTPVASLTLIDCEAPQQNNVLGREYTLTEALVELIDAIELRLGNSLGINVDTLETLAHDAQLRLLHRAMIQAGLLPQRSPVGVLKGSVRTFATALRTRYRPRQSFLRPVSLVLTDDPRLDNEENKDKHQAMLTGWQRYAQDLKSWHGPGTHFSILVPPHVDTFAKWWSENLPPLKHKDQ